MGNLHQAFVCQTSSPKKYWGVEELNVFFLNAWGDCSCILHLSAPKSRDSLRLRGIFTATTQSRDFLRPKNARFLAIKNGKWRAIFSAIKRTKLRNACDTWVCCQKSLANGDARFWRTQFSIASTALTTVAVSMFYKVQAQWREGTRPLVRDEMPLRLKNWVSRQVLDVMVRKHVLGRLAHEESRWKQDCAEIG